MALFFFDTKGVKRVLQARLNEVAEFSDISEYVLQEAHPTESDVEDGPEATFSDTKDFKRAIRLTELGPRMTLKLQKIEDAFFSGEILYHSYIQKTPEEIAKLKKKQEKLRLEKLRRKQEQERNVERKKRAQTKAPEGEPDVSDDDDAKYYEQEVGEKPEPGLFSVATQSKREKYNPLYKKRKKNEGPGAGEQQPRKRSFSKGPNSKRQKISRPDSSLKRKGDGHKKRVKFAK